MPTAPEERAAVALPQLEQYEVLAPIARGGMAEVFLGRLRTRPDRLVALKIMRSELCRNQEFVSMFLDEARIASSLAHPNIAAIYGLGHDRGHHYLAMELLRGRTLLDFVDIALRKGGRIPYEIVAWIGARIADALHFAHEQRDANGANSQIVHRDVNPSNIFVTFAGEPKLIDFGLAKARDRITATAHGVLKGKLAYLAPEQVTGSPIDRRSDVFALGVTLWEISVGDRLFREDSDVETIRRVSRAEVPDPTTRDATYPRALADVVLRALKRTPNERYRTAHELAVALDAFVAASGRPVDAQQVALLARSLFPRDSALPWETLASELERQSSRDDAFAGGSLVRAWDDEAQKMTWMGVEASALDDPSPGPLATRTATLASLPWRETLESRVGERLASMQPNDAVARSRALLELALVDEWLGEGKAALAHVEASVQATPSAVAYSALRRLRRPACDAAALVALVDAEIERVSDQAPRADLFAERGRLLQVVGDAKAAGASFAQALSVDADHPAALKGLEVVLRGGGAESRAKLAAHLGRMAEAYDNDPALAAWLHVERAALLDALDQVEEAKGALVRALELEQKLGPVRAACMAHATAHRDASWLVSLLLEEAALETRQDRAAALELEAAALCRHRLADAKRAVTILESARGRAVETQLLRRVALDELVVLHERGSRPSASLAMRRERLPLVESAAERATELMAIAILEERGGDPAANVAALDEARSLAPGDESVTDALDLALERAENSARRVTMWSDEAAQSSEPARRVRCLTRAADIAEASGDPVRATELHRAALAAAPAHLESVDALDRLLRARRSDRVVDEASARIALHRHAAEHATDSERRIAHLEVAALLEEEELGDASMAANTHEAILTLAPRRRSALVALARTSRRAGDGARSARALLTEAEHVADARERDALRVRAAEMLAATDADRAAALLAEVLEGGDAEAVTRARALKRRIMNAPSSGRSWIASSQPRSNKPPERATRSTYCSRVPSSSEVALRRATTRSRPFTQRWRSTVPIRGPWHSRPRYSTSSETTRRSRLRC